MSTGVKKGHIRSVGEAIKNARREIGLSQKEFGNILNISDKTVSSYEVGRAEPSFNMMKKISSVVRKPITYFDSSQTDDLDLQIKLNIIERELLEIKKLLKKRKR